MTAHEAGGGKGPLVLVCGSDEFKVQECAVAILNKLCPESERDFGLEVVDGAAETVEAAISAIRSCVAALRTVSLMGGRKTVWLRNVNFLDQSVVARSEDVKAVLAALIKLLADGLNPDQALLISAGKVFRASAFYKICKKEGEIREFDTQQYAEKAEPQARDFLMNMLAQSGLKLDAPAIELFLQRVGTDSRQIVMEIEKLAVYAGATQTVTRADVEAVTSAVRQAERWDFATAVGHRDTAGALSVFRQLLFQKETPIGLIIALEYHFHTLLLLRECMNRKWLVFRGSSAQWNLSDKIAESFARLKQDPTKTHPFRTGLLMEQAQRWTLAEIKNAFCDIVDIHRRMVSGSMSDKPHLHVELLLVRLAVANTKHS